jgi:hypothetical protein
MRIRHIKPGFFTDEVLAECEPMARLLFAALWCLADCAGRLEDRPKRIKAEALPYDDCDAESLLTQLDSRGFIQRYEAGGVRLIQVCNFAKHQRLSGHEAAAKSEWEAPPKRPALPGCFPSASPVLQQIPVRGGEVRGGEGRGIHTSTGVDGGGVSSQEALPLKAKHPADELSELWSKTAPPKCPRWRTVTDARRRKVESRFAESEAKNHPGGPLRWWADEVMARVCASPFLRGETGWTVDLDWLLEPANLTKVLEDKYAGREPEPPPKPPKDVRVGRIAAEDFDWTNEPVGDVTDEF